MEVYEVSAHKGLNKPFRAFVEADSEESAKGMVTTVLAYVDHTHSIVIDDTRLLPREECEVYAAMEEAGMAVPFLLTQDVFQEFSRDPSSLCLEEVRRKEAATV